MGMIGTLGGRQMVDLSDPKAIGLVMRWHFYFLWLSHRKCHRFPLR